MAERGTPNPAVGGSSPPRPAGWKMERLKDFIKSVRKELDKVSWPQKNLVIKATISVIIFSLFFGISLWVFDLAFTRLIHLLLSLRG